MPLGDGLGRVNELCECFAEIESTFPFRSYVRTKYLPCGERADTVEHKLLQSRNIQEVRRAQRRFGQRTRGCTRRIPSLGRRSRWGWGGSALRTSRIFST